MNHQNMRLKNISLISPMTSYSKLNSFVYPEDKRDHRRGVSSYLQFNNGVMYKNSSLLHQNNNYQSKLSNNYSKDLKAQSHSKSGLEDNMMKSASSSFSMLNPRYQFNTKRYPSNTTERKVKSNTSSSEYQLITSPSSSSSIGKQQVSKNSASLRNIKVFYSELSKHLKQESPNQNQIQLSDESIQKKIKVNPNRNSSNEMQKLRENTSLQENQGLIQFQPSTKTTKESTDNSIMKSKNKPSCSNAYNNNLNAANKNNRNNKLINTTEINTPEELHYFYVNILQNGKEIESHFDKSTSERDYCENKK